MKILKVFLILLATALMGAVIVFIRDSSIVDSMAAVYAISLNGFLGVDIASMIKSSSSLPVGEYKAMHFYRYVIAFICMMLLFVLSLYQKEVNQVQSIMAISAFGSGSMLIIGMVMSGLEGNKIAGKSGEKKNVVVNN